MIQLEKLNALCRTPDSAITLVKRAVHLALQPQYLGNINAGILTLLNRNIYKYYPELKGILMGYNKIKLKKRDGGITNDQPFIHIDVQAEFYIFNPKKGVALRGRVNKKSAGHVGCLVHDVFNAAITPPIGANLSRWCGARAQIGKQITFITTAVSFGDKVPIIQGRLEEAGLDVEQDNNEETIEEVEEFEESQVIDYDSGIDSIGKTEKRKREEEEEVEEDEQARKKRKKAEKKKRKEKEREEAERAEKEALVLNTTVESVSNESGEEKVKKKKNKKDQDESQNEIDHSSPSKVSASPHTPKASGDGSPKPETPKSKNALKPTEKDLPEGWRVETRGQGGKRLYKKYMSPEGKSFPSVAQALKHIESGVNTSVVVGEKVEKELESAVKKSKGNSDQINDMVNFIANMWNRNFDDQLMSDNPEFYHNPALRSLPNKPEYFEKVAKSAPKKPRVKSEPKSSSPPKPAAQDLNKSSNVGDLSLQSKNTVGLADENENDFMDIQDESLSIKKEKKKKKKKHKEREKEEN